MAWIGHIEVRQGQFIMVLIAFFKQFWRMENVWIMYRLIQTWQMFLLRDVGKRQDLLLEGPSDFIRSVSPVSVGFCFHPARWVFSSCANVSQSHQRLQLEARCVENVSNGLLKKKMLTHLRKGEFESWINSDFFLRSPFWSCSVFSFQMVYVNGTKHRSALGFRAEWQSAEARAVMGWQAWGKRH